MNTKSNLDRVVEELTIYAVERHIRFERHQGSMARLPEERDEWISGVLRGMAEVAGADPDKLIASFDGQLEQAKGSAVVKPLFPSGQSHIVQTLRWYSNALDGLDGDQRPRAMEILKLLEDFAAYPQWDTFHTMTDPVRSQVEEQLLRMAARRPIRFTRIVLGGDLTPGGTEFMPGLVDDAAGVRRTQVFQRIVKKYPKRAEWPALCTVYLGGGQQSAPNMIDADELDMAIIRETGGRFLEQAEIIPMSCRALCVPVHEIVQEKGHSDKPPKRKGQER